MPKTGKNSNYQTPKREAERVLRENEKKRAKRKKIITTVAISAISLLLVVAIIVGIIGWNSGWFDEEEVKVTHYAVLIFDEYPGIEGNAEVHIELYGDEAPDTVANFIKLAKDGKYNETYFHSIVDGYIARAGDIDGVVDGVSSGSFDTVKGEFSENGFNNRVKHEMGTVSMYRPGGYDSASSQFFVVLEGSEENSEKLDGKYAAFGKVVKGMNFFTMVAEGKDSSLLPIEERPKIMSIEIRTPEEHQQKTQYIE